VSNSLVAFALPDIPRKPLPPSVTAAVAVAAKARRGTPQVGKSAPVTLPSGGAKALVEKTCNTACHSVEVVTTQRLSRDEWNSVVRSMVARGAPASEEEVKSIVDYLSRTLGR
jgi:cytochrome c5